MAGKWIISLLVVMNGALLYSNWSLTKSLGALGGWSRVLALEERLTRETGTLSAERARFADGLSRLTSRLETFDAAWRTFERGTGAISDIEPALGTQADISDLLAQAGIGDKPRPLDIPPMSEDERSHLQSIWSTLPPLSGQKLLGGSVDAVLDDPEWNPDRRVLNPEERLQLKKLLDDYTYFARISYMERYRGYVAPEVPRLREAGAYIEYPAKEPPPPIEPGLFTSRCSFCCQ